MRAICTFVVLVLLGCLSATARGDGLFYRLPQDGAWVEYEVTGSEINPDGSVDEGGDTISDFSSVGTETVDDKKCRWIEFKIDSQKDNRATPTKIFKLLIPEQQLVRGKAPYQHILKVWVKRGDQPEREIDKSRLEVLQVFLLGPPEPEKKLTPVKIESGLGNLECDLRWCPENMCLKGRIEVTRANTQ